MRCLRIPDNKTDFYIFNNNSLFARLYESIKDELWKIANKDSSANICEKNWTFLFAQKKSVNLTLIRFSNYFQCQVCSTII